MIRLAALLLASSACSSVPILPECSETIYGAQIQPVEPCLPPLQVWVREAVWLTFERCPIVEEVLLACPAADGYSVNAYDVVFDYDAGIFIWKGAVRTPAGGLVCEQDGGGFIGRVE